MPYALFVNSSTGVSFDPEYDFRESARKIEARHRVRSGREYVYKWGDYATWRMSVEYVNSSFMSQVNNWWLNNTELLFMLEGTLQVYSVRLAGARSPITSFIRPYNDLFKGKIDIGTY